MRLKTGMEFVMFASLRNRLQRARNRRKIIKAMGLKRVRIWVPDTRNPKFAEYLRRQAEKMAEADKQDPTIDSFLDAALAENDDWK